MRATALFLMLTACTFDASGLGDDSSSGSSADPIEHYPDAKDRETGGVDTDLPDLGESSGGSSGEPLDPSTSSTTGAADGSSSSIAEIDESSSGSETSTGDPELQPCTYEKCAVISDCGDDPSDRCGGGAQGTCMRTCTTDDECQPGPAWALSDPICNDAGYCVIPCDPQAGTGCIDGQMCSWFGCLWK